MEPIKFEQCIGSDNKLPIVEFDTKAPFSRFTSLSSGFTRNAEKKEETNFCSPLYGAAAVRTSSCTSRKGKLLAVMRKRKQRQLHQKEKLLLGLDCRLAEMCSYVLEADNRPVPQWCPDIKRDVKKLKMQIDQLRNEINQLGKSLDKTSGMNCESEVCFERIHRDFRTEVNKDAHLPNDPECSDYLEKRRLNPSEVVKMVKNFDPFENRRSVLRNELSTNRRNHQLKLVNVCRGLVMLEENTGAAKSDQTFDLKSLDRALPQIAHCSKKAPEKRNKFHLLAMVMKVMKQNPKFRQIIPEELLPKGEGNN